MSIAASIRTAEQLWAAGDIGRCELVQGELRMMSPAGANHGRLTSRLNLRIALHVEQRKLGEVFGAETGFIISRNPDTVRAPDVAFVKNDRVALIRERGFFPGPPDLAVEVLSPDDPASEVLAKVEDWLTAGTAEVWIVDPSRKSISIHFKDQPVRTLRGSDELTSESLLPGFGIKVAEIFH